MTILCTNSGCCAQGSRTASSSSCAEVHGKSASLFADATRMKGTPYEDHSRHTSMSSLHITCGRPYAHVVSLSLSLSLSILLFFLLPFLPALCSELPAAASGSSSELRRFRPDTRSPHGTTTSSCETRCGLTRARGTRGPTCRPAAHATERTIRVRAPWLTRVTKSWGTCLPPLSTPQRSGFSVFLYTFHGEPALDTLCSVRQKCTYPPSLYVPIAFI